MKVFNESNLARLAATNRALRWLRAHGLVAQAVSFGTSCPTITVGAAAEPVLVRQASGFNAVQADGHRVRYVLIDGCAVQWSAAQ